MSSSAASKGRKELEKCIGKTVAEVSHTDLDEYRRTGKLFYYLMFDEGTVFRASPEGFKVFPPGKYEGRP